MDDKLANLRRLLNENSLDAFFVSSLPNIAYLTGYGGFSAQDRDAFLLITQNSQYIFTHGIYREDVKNKVNHFTLIDIKRENPISTAIKKAVQEHGIKKLGFEAFDLKVAEYDRLTKEIEKEILFPLDVIAKLRIYKSSKEIETLKQACLLGDKAFAYMVKELHEGMTELEAAALLEYFIKSQGSDISFPTIIAFEENAAHPHHMPTQKKLRTDSFVLMDFGVRHNNYCSDMTRTISFGNVSKEDVHVYQIVREAQQRAIAFIEKQLAKKETIRAREVDNIAREFIISKNYPTMPHSLGHGIGVEVHESPRLTPVTEEFLEEEMVFSIEPGIYLPEKVGVRIEDLFAIQNKKLVQLTNSPRDLLG